MLEDIKAQRIHKVLAHAGVASRRHIEMMIRDGRVKVNGSVLREQGVQIDPDTDRIEVDGKFIVTNSDAQEEKVYFLLNKPAGVVSSANDEKGRKTVLDLVKGMDKTRIYPVGRLDFDSEGALLLTNDGDLCNKLIHPRHHVKKTYMVKVKGEPKEEMLNKLRRGIYLEDGPTGTSEITVVDKARVNTWVEVVLTQGKYRQIKRMFWRIGHPVCRLVRTHFAGLGVEGLHPGQYRALSKRELQFLQSQVH